MIVTIANNTLRLCEGDITSQEVDAIVNAANSWLAGGGGVDGAIHRRGGPEIMEETKRLYPDGCPTGNAVVSSAGKLSAKYVIHAVGPVWNGGTNGEAEQLRSAYQSCLVIAQEHACQSVAFPSLSTGAYRFPIEQASEIALNTAVEFLSANDCPREIVFVLFGQAAYQVFERTLQTIADTIA